MKIKEKFQYKKIAKLYNDLGRLYNDNYAFWKNLEKDENTEKFEELFENIKLNLKSNYETLENDLYKLLKEDHPDNQINFINFEKTCEFWYDQSYTFAGSHFTRPGGDRFLDIRIPLDDKALEYYKTENNKEYWKYKKDAFDKELKSLKAASLLLKDNDYLPDIINEFKSQIKLANQITQDLDNLKYLMSQDELEELDDVGIEMQRLAKLV